MTKGKEKTCIDDLARRFETYTVNFCLNKYLPIFIHVIGHGFDGIIHQTSMGCMIINKKFHCYISTLNSISNSIIDEGPRPFWFFENHFGNIFCHSNVDKLKMRSNDI